jgi:hypothetical protein
MGESLGGFGRCYLCGRRLGFLASIRAVGFFWGNPVVSGQCWRCRLREHGLAVERSSSGYHVTWKGNKIDERVFEDEESAWREAEDVWRRTTYGH